MLPPAWDRTAIFTDTELSQILNVHKQTLANWRSAGKTDLLPRWIKRGREVIYLREDVEAYLETLRTPA